MVVFGQVKRVEETQSAIVFKILYCYIVVLLYCCMAIQQYNTTTIQQYS